MITPQEAESHVFSKATFGGYSMAQVDDFLDTIIADYTALYKENAALKSKLKVLADKIEEYRATEDAMRKALMTAQNMAESIVRDAEAKRDAALQETRADTDRQIGEIRRDLANEEYRLTAAKNSTIAFVSKLKTLYAHELDFIGRLSELTEPVAAPDAAQDIEDTMSRMFGGGTAPKAPAAQVPAAPPAEEDPEDSELDATVVLSSPKVRKAAAKQQKAASRQAAPAPAPREEEELPDEPAEDSDELSDTLIFDNLQFGKDYDFE